MPEHILLRHRDIPNLTQLSVYRQNGGFTAFQNAVTSMQPEAVIDVVKNSGLRGRGGAGFPTGQKWAFTDKRNWPHYVVANGDESEPGTFKDREILEGNPFQFLEGVAIAAYAVQAHAAYIYLRGEFWQVAAKLDARIAEMEAAGLLGERLSIPVEVLDPFSIFPHHLKGEEVARLLPHSGVAVAAGLALRNLGQAWPNST